MRCVPIPGTGSLRTLKASKTDRVFPKTCIMGMLRNIMRQGKDLALSSAIEKIAEKYVSPFGKLLSFHLDTSGRSMEITVLLKGESEPVTISVCEYELSIAGDESFVLLNRVKASRQWIEALSQEYLLNRKIRIPSHVAKMLGFLS